MQKLRYTAPGSAPATLVPLPEQAGCKPKLQLIEYDAHSFQEREIELADLESLHSSRVNWINVGGLGDVETLQKLGEHFRVHPLALEDVFNTGQRPHIDEYEKQLFIVLQMAYEETEGELVFEQVSLVLGDHYVITIQEDAATDVFEPVRKRLREGLGHVRFLRSDYLAYTLIDAVIDQFFPLSEALGDSIEEMEEDVLTTPTRDNMQQIHEFRQALAQLRRAVWPARDVLTAHHRLFDLHSAHFYRWIVRHELRQHARTTLEVRLPSCPGDHVGCSRRHDPVLQAKELVVIAPATAQKIAKTDFLNRRSQRRLLRPFKSSRRIFAPRNTNLSIRVF